MLTLLRSGGYRARALLTVGVVLVSAVVFLACGGSSTASTGSTNSNSQASATNTPMPPTATAKPKAWVTVQHFSGSQNTQTPTFHLANGSRIVWKATPTDTNANILSIELDQTDGTPIDLVANTANMSSPQSSTYNVHGDNDVYLKITTDSVNYDVQVQEYK